MEYTQFAVGQPYPFAVESTKKMKDQDGAVFESLEEGDGFIFTIYLNGPHPREIDLVRKAKMQIRLVQDGKFVLPLVKFGDSLMIFELSMDPTLYTDARALQMAKNNNMLIVSLVDSSNGILVALRQASFPLRMIQVCAENWANAYLDSDFSEDYFKWYRQLQQFSLEDLWAKGEPAGSMGESYDLNEIGYSLDSQHYKKK